MSQGRSLRLFLVDGTPNGLLTAEIMNWTGHVLTGPRSKLPELIKRPECKRAGIYLLVGPDPENSLVTRVYVGESDDVATRLKQHDLSESKGGKDFWERVCLVTSKDQNLTKAHVKHLEGSLIQIVGQASGCVLLNEKTRPYLNLPEADIADMGFFLEQIRTVLPTLGFDFVRHKPSLDKPAAGVVPADISPEFVLTLGKYQIRATAREIDGEFVVLKGSTGQASWVGVPGSYQGLFNQLQAEGVIQLNAKGLMEFQQDYVFKSPSAAAAVVSGRSANGRTVWVLESSGQTYADWQTAQLNESQGADALSSEVRVSQVADMFDQQQTVKTP